MALFGNGNGTGAFGGLFRQAPPGADTFGAPRTPFQRTFDPEAQRTTLTGFLGRVAGNPTGSERAGAAGGALFRKFAQLQASGLNSKQALIKVTEDPSFMDAFINSEDPGSLIQQLLAANSQFDADNAPGKPQDMISTPPGNAIFDPNTNQEVYRNPTADLQTTGGYIEGAGMSPAETEATYRAILDAEQSGDQTEKEAATAWLVSAGKITEDERQMILSGLIGPKSEQDAEGRSIDRGLWDYSKNRPWVPAMSGGDMQGGEPISGGEGTDELWGDTATDSVPTFLDKSGEYAPLYEAAGSRYGVPAELLARQGYAESGWNPQAKSPAGAQGIAQFMPATAKEYGVNPADPQSSIDGQARYMAKYLREFNGDTAAALVAYNWGPSNARKWVKAGKPGSMLPGETRGYLAKILGGPGQRDFTDNVYGPLAAIPTRPGREVRGRGGSTRLRGGGAISGDDLSMPAGPAPGFGETGAAPEVDVPTADTPEGLSEGFKELTGMGGAEASLYGTGTGPAIAEFMGNLLSDVSGNPKYLNPRAMAARNALRTIRENTVLYYGKLGRESAQEAARIQELAASLGAFKTPADSILKLGELRKNILRAVARDHKIAESSPKDDFGVVRQADAKERIRDAELILSQIGDERQLAEAYYYATHNPQPHLMDYIAGAFSGATEVGSDEFNRTPGAQSGSPKSAEDFNAIAEAMRLGTFPSDEQLQGLTEEQWNQLEAIAAEVDAGKGKKKGDKK